MAELSLSTVAVTGTYLELVSAEVECSSVLLGSAPLPRRSVPFDAGTVLGRGVRYKDEATLLGLAVAKGALHDAQILQGGSMTVPGDRVGVVVSSNLGNLDTVCSVAAQIERNGVESISPMGLPNASSNIVASSIAIRFGLRGPNLTFCNGDTSGTDALAWAALLILRSRADCVVVVGVETDNEVVRALTRSADDCRPPFSGAVAVVLERGCDAERRSAEVLAHLGSYAHRRSAAEALALILPVTPNHTLALGSCDALSSDSDRCDLDSRLGPTSGALGVLQAAVCANAIGRGECESAVAVTGSDGASYAALTLACAAASEEPVHRMSKASA